MMSKQTVAAMILFLALGAASFPRAAAGQLPSASTATLATANNYTALARGFTAIALNPAGLGMPGNPGFSLALLPVQARAGLNAISLSEIDSFGGQTLPAATKDEWLQSVITEGGLTARAGLAATAFALSAGPVGVQVSTVGEASASLGPDAFELALFGNAGRTGTTRDMTLAGTEANGWGATTVALALGIPLPETKGGSLAAGATLKYTVGHVVLAARDDGSAITANPIGIDLALSSILPDSSSVNNGTGMGLDIGVAWQDSTWAVSAAVQNVFHTFQWTLDAFAFRPGTVLADNASVTADFDAVPVASAPVTLVDELLAQSFEPVVNLGVAYRATSRIALMADFRHDSGEALVHGEGSHIGMSVEFRMVPFLPLRGGLSRVSGGAVHLAAGFGLEVGPVNLSAAYLTEKNSAGQFRAASVALSFGHN